MCLESDTQNPDYDDDQIQLFPDAIAECPLPTFPNLDELRYGTHTNCAADSIFTGLLKVSIIHFPQLLLRIIENYIVSFFEALIDYSSR